MFNFRIQTLDDTNKMIINHLKKHIITPFSFKKIFEDKPQLDIFTIDIYTPYCDEFFWKNEGYMVGNTQILKEYSAYLIKQIEKLGTKFLANKKIVELSFTGVASSIYSCEDLEKIFTSINNIFTFSNDTCRSFETSLLSLSKEKINLLKKYKIDTIILNIPTFSQIGREKLGFSLSEKEVIDKIKDIQKEFNDNIKLKLLYNYPDQSISEILYDAEIISTLDINYIEFNNFNKKVSETLSSNTIEYDFNLQNEEKLYSTFLEKLYNNGYKIHSFNSLSNNNEKPIVEKENCISIGIKTSGNIGLYEYFTQNKFLAFYIKNDEFSIKLKKLISVLNNVTVNLTMLRLIAGDTIYPEIMNFLYELHQNGLIEFEENTFKYTGKGLFWGYTIIYIIINKTIKYKYMK